MASLGLADQTDLLRWADSRSAPADLPRLIRRLILETGRGVVQLGFPGGEGIAGGGWDGTARASENTAYVPAGLSLWELSVEKNVGSKADRDYAKRVSTPDGSPTSDATYIAVSLRRWLKRQDWAVQKTSEGRWKAVRAYGVDDLETWLGSAPVTHAWISELLGLYPFGLTTFEAWWASWSSATDPEFPITAVLSGRSNAADALQAALAGPPRIITINAASHDDVGAFVTAVARRAATVDGGALLARSAFIDKVETWRHYRDIGSSLVLVLSPDVSRELGGSSRHHVIIPVVGASSADITLPAIDPIEAKAALQHAGFPEKKAEETGRIARMSVLAARRRIAIKPELHRPSWATGPTKRLVRRLLLAGKWSESSPGDVEALGKLAGVSYDSVRDDITSLAAGGDPLLVRLDSLIAVVSHFDAWLLLSPQLTQDDLEAFHSAAIEILGALDPKLELAPSDRWKASVLGKTRSCSTDLRTGLATTLALLGAHGAAPVQGSPYTQQDWASLIVRKLLNAANGDKTGGRWASVADVLTLLAEAAPLEFLEAVRDGLMGETPVLRTLFTDRDDIASIFLHSDHTNLLWALELCAWSPTYFGQAVDLLARLDEVDPGGRLGNRPLASLKSIFCPWSPQTGLGTSRRLAVLDALRERHAQTAWKLMLSMLPDTFQTSDPTSKPRFRDWKTERPTVTGQDYWMLVERVCERLVNDAGTSGSRWTPLIDELDHFPPSVRERALERLTELSTSDAIGTDERRDIWSSLRSFVAHHTEFADAEWALPSKVIQPIDAIAKQFEPSAPTARLAWLFDEHQPEIPKITWRENHEAYYKELGRLRAETIREISAALEWSGFHAFAATVKLPWVVGAALAASGVKKFESEVMTLLKSANSSDVNLAMSYVSHRFLSERWTWIEQRLADESLSNEQRGRILVATYDHPKAWEVAHQLGIDVESAFWHHFQVHGLGTDFTHVETAATRLLGVGRPAAALGLLTLYLRPEQDANRAELAASGFEALLQLGMDDREARGLSSYDYQQLFACIKASSLPRVRVARLEWAFLPALDYKASPSTLNEHLAESPAFFVEVISRVYRPRRPDEADAPESPVSPEEAHEKTDEGVVRNAYRLLSQWRRLPGTRGDGSVDASALNEWISEARRLLRDVHRIEVGDVHIGMVLASCPSDPDGGWPCRVVRDLLEKLQSPKIESGFQNAIHNSRGGTRRGLLDGGEQERSLVKKYLAGADQFIDAWPRTAAVLRLMAASYEREARRHDEDVERRQKGFDS